MAEHPKIPHRAKGEAANLSQVQDTETVHHEPRKAPRPKGVPDLNLTSMMDVCFQLLIFFVLTASFAVGEGILPADLPTGQGAASKTDPPKQPIKIFLRSLGGDDVSIQIEGSPTPPTDFEELFRMLKGNLNSPENPTGVYTDEDPIIIKPDGTVKWKGVVAAFNAAVRAKYKNVNFAQPNK